ncbi:hypothetical protein TNCV_4002611 [Trichonephila clavipes]|uniref:Uncharacterized protein n=1 Tax=Trichonephila clavipes TaxID=2585209 RepID=A0A8X6V872_TRICX|nr:hypothetical protein TNCV_4002611 [Trichonephila clavipes]
MGKEELTNIVPCVAVHYPYGIWLISSAECMKGPRVPTPQRCRAGCSMYRQCILERYAVKSNTTLNHDTGCRTTLAMHTTTIPQPLTTVSPNLNLTIATLQAEAVFISKQNVVTFCCPYSPLIAPLAAQTFVVSGQG